MTDPTTSWHKALEPDDLPDGRVTTVTIGTHTLCPTHHQGQFGALDNHCPHQGGPLGEGAIEPGKPGVPPKLSERGYPYYLRRT